MREGDRVNYRKPPSRQPPVASRQRGLTLAIPKASQPLHPLNRLETEYGARLDLVNSPTRMGRSSPPVPQFPQAASQHLGESQTSLGFREPQGYHFLASLLPISAFLAPPSWDPAASPLKSAPLRELDPGLLTAGRAMPRVPDSLHNQPSTTPV